MIKHITQDCYFIFGASNIKSFPDELVEEIALAGRSNVGKSSLINLLVNSKKIARVSSKPGCTRQINFYSVCRNKIRLADLPGYGYSRASKVEKAEYLHLIEYYLANRKNLKEVFVLIDGKIGLKEIDKNFIYWLKYKNINFRIILTKIDKVNKEDLNAVLQHIKIWSYNQGILIDNLRMVSNHIKYTLDELKSEIFKFRQNCNK
ncbi:ribosome biogenesis GTP-binding protein YihA/YsxC [Wolbachia endosymbiont of Pentidionis agamae]|uniref:ribosome biogenesis GTP-binding protein YihA/YsxC n=1 Tax=Wolbachia endosymbiont of Pentidionis agamae TaxID=3110435 RepID=UPI002FD76943